MSTYPNSTVTVERLCRSSGFDFEELQKVRNGIYRGVLRNRQLENSSTAFIKFYSSSKRQQLGKFVDVATDAGHPECQVVDGQYLCLVMGVADGRPLSQHLPFVFLPWFWRFRKKQYQQVYFQIGQQLGRLHSATQSDQGPVLTERKQEKALQQAEFLDYQLAQSTINKMRTLLKSASDRQTSYALTYGDRAPHNIFFNGKTVSQIDFIGTRGSTAYDHASLILGLRLMHRRLPYVGSTDKFELEQSYWDGYEQTGITPVPDTETIAIRLIDKYIDLIDFYQSDVYSLNARLTKWVDPPKIRAEIRRTVEDVS